jgi:integrase
MKTLEQSAGEPRANLSGIARGADLTVADLVDEYMLAYCGRDTTRATRLAWWRERLGAMRLSDVSDDDVYFAMESLAQQRGRYYAGRDAEGRPILKAKARPIAPATLNRYQAAASALFSWAIRTRRAPKTWDNPCRRLEMRTERNERVRFLSDDERERLLAACRASKWDRLYLLVLMALTTGARRGELEGLRWSAIDLQRGEARLFDTKNGEPRVLVLLPAVLEELRKHSGAPSSLGFASRRRPDQAYTSDPAWRAALRVAKLRDFRFHDLRHSCASYLAQAGAGLLEIAEVLGHKQLTVTRRYSHLTTTHRRALVGRVLGDIR